MEERKMSEKEAMELIARSLEAQRRKLSFVRSTLFFGAGALALAVTTADYVVRRTTGRNLTLLLVLAGTVAGLAALYFHYRSHRTVTANDRTLMNVWAYALGVCLYTAGYVATGDGLQLPVMGLLTMGAAIAAGVTGELFRRSETRADRWPDCFSSAFRGHFSPHGSSGPQQQERPSPNSYSPLRQPSSSSSEQESCCATTNAGTVFKELNPLLHSELRLAVMSILIGVESADFVFIRQQTGATAGNLSVQLDKLAKANYIEIEKTFRGKMPCTVCRITDTGRDAFAEYVAALQTYIRK